MYAVLDHASPELARRLLRHDAAEDQLDPVRPPEVQVVADDLFEELPPAQRPVELIAFWLTAEKSASGFS